MTCRLIRSVARRGVVGVAAGLVARAPVVRAQVAPADTLPTFERPNGALLRPGAFTYQLTLRRDTAVRDLGIRAVAVSETTIDGVSGWVVAESRLGTPVSTVDTVVLSRADRSPARGVAARVGARLAASFSRDSMFGAMQSYQGRASFVVPLPPGALLSAGMVDRVLELLPLQPGYRTGASLVLVELGTPRAVPAEIAVERDENVQVGDSTIATWVVRLRAGTLEERLWVSKDAPRVVKTEQATDVGVLTALMRPAPPGTPAAVVVAGALPPGLPIIIPGSPPIYLPVDKPAPKPPR